MANWLAGSGVELLKANHTLLPTDEADLDLISAPERAGHQISRKNRRSTPRQAEPPAPPCFPFPAWEKEGTEMACQCFQELVARAANQ